MIEQIPLTEYKEGYPPKQGWYDCIVDGEPMTLKYYFCQMRMKHTWISEDSEYIFGDIRWRGEPKEHAR